MIQSNYNILIIIQQKNAKDRKSNFLGGITMFSLLSLINHSIISFVSLLKITILVGFYCSIFLGGQYVFGALSAEYILDGDLVRIQIVGDITNYHWGKTMEKPIPSASHGLSSSSLIRYGHFGGVWPIFRTHIMFIQWRFRMIVWDAKKPIFSCQHLTQDFSKPILFPSAH